MKIIRLYCEVPGCKKTFRTQEALDFHSNNDHSSTFLAPSNQFKCPDCSKTLSTKQSLKEHLYTHTGEKPYKCLEAGCGLLFRQSSQLSNHRRVHQEIKKNIPEISKINLLVLSKLFSQQKPYIYSIPAGPYSLIDAHLPDLKKEILSE
jgi:uncharacterized Zn-finger protein